MATPESIARYLLKSVNRAVREFEMLADGDRVAVGVSGGKDSRTLLELLVRGVDIPGHYDVVAIHVDGNDVGLPDQRPALEPWFRALGVPYTIARLALPEEEPLPLDCFRCAWNRRKALFLAAEQQGCNKIALGHHADDAAVTTLLSILYKGRIEPLSPRREYFDKQFLAIRPLIYVTERDIRRYARACGWEFPPELDCPQGEQSSRVQVERFLAGLPLRERKQICTNLWRLSQKDGEAPGDC